MRSLRKRLLLVASLVLAAFLGLGALGLDRAFRESAESALREGLREQVFALLGAADEDAQGRMRLPDNLPNPRFSAPDSGLYAMVVGERGDYRWNSFSMVGRPPLELRRMAPGKHVFERSKQGSEELEVFHFGLSWEGFEGRELEYTIVVAASTAGMMSQVEGFRARLFYWLGGGALLLLVTQVLVLRWGLGPLRRVAEDLRRVESGDIDQIYGHYPEELDGLVRNLNALILSGKAARDRYRNSLGDLAHSLKTPLALLQAAMDSGRERELRTAVADQIPRMDEIIQYQLRRAATSAAGERVAPVSVVGVIIRLRATLDKVYSGKQVGIETDLHENLRFLGDEADLLEILGNLMDNAYKYCGRRVRVRGVAEPSEEGRKRWLALWVEDDGPGIPRDQRAEVVSRGVRVDQHQPGQGIGLSVAREIVNLYGGAMEIGQSALGGASIRFTLPRS